MMQKSCWIVVPCYNEEEVIEITYGALAEKLTCLISTGNVSDQSTICFVDDGSKDKTWEIIERLVQESTSKGIKVTGVRLSRNYGHQNALLAGLMTAKNCADVTISMDADLQDDINAIDEMLVEYDNGNDIVYGVRNNRDTDTAFKRKSAEFFYKLADYCGVKLVYNSADYRLMSRKALDCLEDFGEVNLFLRGIIPMIGLKSSCVYYKRNKRVAGESKYPLKKMISFALEGITSFSVQPIKIITRIGFLFALIGVLLTIWNIIGKINGNVIQGWTSIMASLWIIGGIQICSIGVIGEYIGKIYLETKHRPRYIIDKIVGEEVKAV